jgi:hypothetical protein
LKDRGEDFRLSGLDPQGVSDLRVFLQYGWTAFTAGDGGVAIPLAGYAGSGELPEGAGGRLGCGIIGLGSRGREVAAVLSRIERARVVALCATIPQR